MSTNNSGFFRSRPVVVQAFQMTVDRIHSNEEWPDWLHEAWNKERGDALYLHYSSPRTIAVHTLEGPMIVRPNDWLIKGTQGEIYPCKPEVFAERYEAVER